MNRLFSQIFYRQTTISKMNLYEPSVQTQHAYFGQQCFWGPDGQYGVIDGVIRTRVGYTGGSTKNPTYHNLNDHTETTDIEFDASKISYQDLLKIFFESHDPTFQHKAQYMSAIFYVDDEQRTLAQTAVDQHQKLFDKKIVTKILPFNTFYNAEDYHQKYRLRGHSWLLKSLNLSDAQVITSHVASRLNGYMSGYGSLEKFNQEAEKLGLTKEQIDYVNKNFPSSKGSCSKS